MEERKLFLIPAVPSSGTSALAGVLHHLGVNMGNLTPEDAIEKRGYEMFEDKDVWKYVAIPNREPDVYVGKLSLTLLRLRSYINYRLVRDTQNPVGAKIPGVLCVHDPELESLPIVTLNVHRQFEKCLASDRNVNIRVGKYEAFNGDIDKIITFNRMRAADMGACLSGKMDLFMVHDPVVNITFDDLIAKKEEIVPDIAKRLKLTPTDEQLETAINFLDKDKKHS